MALTLEQARANIGRGVVYHPTPDAVEQGVITSANAMYVFVRYDGNQYPKATAPEHLDWAERRCGMNAPTTDALASALPAALTYDAGSGITWKNHKIAAFQAERLAEAGYVLVHTAPDEATVERLADIIGRGPSGRAAMRSIIPSVLAALAGTSAQARHTADDATLPANPDDLLTPQERKALNDDLTQMARKRRDAEVKHAGEVLP